MTVYIIVHYNQDGEMQLIESVWDDSNRAAAAKIQHALLSHRPTSEYEIITRELNQLRNE